MSEPTEDRARQALKIMGRERARLSEAIDGLAAARAALDRLIEDNHAYLGPGCVQPVVDTPPAAMARVMWRCHPG
jgi:hypothetical protein